MNIFVLLSTCIHLISGYIVYIFFAGGKIPLINISAKGGILWGVLLTVGFVSSLNFLLYLLMFIFIFMKTWFEKIVPKKVTTLNELQKMNNSLVVIRLIASFIAPMIGAVAGCVTHYFL